MRKMYRLYRPITIHNPQSHRHLTVIEVYYNRTSDSTMHIFSRYILGNILHILIIKLNRIRMIIQTNRNLQISRKIYLFYPSIMYQIILLFLLLKPHLKLCLSLLLFQYNQLTHHIFIDLGVCYTIFVLLYDLKKHILQTYHVEWDFLDRKI